MVLSYKGRHVIDNWTSINYLQYVQSLCTPTMLRAGHPTLLTWRRRYDLTRLKTSKITTRSPRLVTECLVTRSMLIKIYVHDIYSRSRAGAIWSIGKYEYDSPGLLFALF